MEFDRAIARTKSTAPAQAGGASAGSASPTRSGERGRSICSTRRASSPTSTCSGPIPGARIVELPGRDHAFWFGAFGTIVDEIEAFVTGGTPSAPAERALATLLFTDIVDSTKRAAALGDGALAKFESPAGAVRCGVDLCESLGAIGLPIRAGVHTGECELIGDDVGGVAVHIGARVGAAAKPGEVLVSSTVAELVMGSGLIFEERGSHELKGVPGQWHLLAVGGEGTPTPVREVSAKRERTSDRVLMRIGRGFPGTVRAATRAVRGRGEASG